MKLIKVENNHYVLVDKEKPKEGQWFACFAQGSYKGKGRGWFLSYHNGSAKSKLNSICEDTYRITHSTKPLNKEFNDWFDAKIITLEEVNELLAKVDIKTSEWEVEFNQENKLILK